MTEQNQEAIRKTGSSTSKKAATVGNKEHITTLKTADKAPSPATGTSSRTPSGTTAKTSSVKTANKKVSSSSKKSNKKPTKKKKAKKFKRSTSLHRFFSYVEKNFTLFTVILIVTLFIIAIFLTGMLVGLKLHKDITTTRDIESLIAKYSSKYNVPYDVVYAVIETESSFRPDAVSSSDARGLMQITKITLTDINNRLGTNYTMNDLFDSEINVELGTFYLSYLYQRFGNYETVYAAYNAGPTIVSEWLQDTKYSEDGKTLIHEAIPYQETKRYVEKVIAFRDDYIESHNS